MWRDLLCRLPQVTQWSSADRDLRAQCNARAPCAAASTRERASLMTYVTPSSAFQQASKCPTGMNGERRNNDRRQVAASSSQDADDEHQWSNTSSPIDSRVVSETSAYVCTYVCNVFNYWRCGKGANDILQTALQTSLITNVESLAVLLAVLVSKNATNASANFFPHIRKWHFICRSILLRDSRKKLCQNITKSVKKPFKTVICQSFVKEFRDTCRLCYQWTSRQRYRHATCFTFDELPVRICHIFKLYHINSDKLKKNSIADDF